MESSFDELRRAQRKAGIAGRGGLTAEQRRLYSEQIVQRILASEAYQKAKVIFSYRAIKAEVSLLSLEAEARAQGKTIAFPLCVAPGEMIALVPDSEESWVEGSFHIPEPLRSLSTEIAPSDFDLMLCPCTAFDGQCRRMGMGGGYYDRYLPRCGNALITSVAFEAQKLPEIAVEPWDFAMDGVFTEAAFYSKP